MQKFSLLAGLLVLLIMFSGCTDNSTGEAINPIQTAKIPQVQEPQEPIVTEQSNISKQDKPEYFLDNSFFPLDNKPKDVFPYGQPTPAEGKIIQDNVLLTQFPESENGFLIVDKRPEFIPIAVKKVEVEKKSSNTASINQELSKHREKIVAEQNRLINVLKAKFPDIDKKIRVKTTNVLNMISVQVDAKDKKKLQDILPTGVEVHENQKVQATLQESVPLINADDVWRRNAQGTPCLQQHLQENTEPIEDTPTGLQIIPTPGPQPQPIPDRAGEQCIDGTGIKIGIIDTGVDYTHEGLGGCFGENCKVIDGYDFANNDSDPMDDYGHGTHVASIAAGNGTLKGVAPNAKIVAYKVLNQYGGGDIDWIIAGIDRSVDPNQNGDYSDHLNVINLSLGWRCHGVYSEECGPNDDMSSAIDNITNFEVIPVVAAGNEGQNEKTIRSPGTARKAITVGAIDKQKNIAQFSSRGPVIWSNGQNTYSEVKPDIVAPGVSICAAQYDSWFEGQAECNPELENHIAISGTSMATPHVAGLAALVKQRNPNYTPEQIKSIIKNTATFLPNPEKITTQGSGLVDAYKAVFTDVPNTVNLNLIEQIGAQSITITGTIQVQNFSSYKIAYSLDNEIQQWNEIFTTTTIPESGILLNNFNIDAMPDGKYVVRLQVFNNSEKSYTDYGYFEIHRFELIEPLNNDIINPKNDLQIKINNLQESPIQNFNIEYSVNDGEWTSQGVVIEDLQNLKAKITSNTILGNAQIKIRTNITHGLTITTFNIFDIYADSTLKEGWPVRLPYQTNPLGYWDPGAFEIGYGNVEGDTANEIIVYTGGIPNQIKVFNKNGQLLEEWPFNTANSVNPIHPLLVDVDGDNLEELILLSVTADGENTLVHAIRANGSQLENWPVEIPRVQQATMMAADIDLDGQPEIIIKGNYNVTGNDKLVILKSSGVILNYFDIPHANTNSFSDIISTPAVGNFDDDPQLEIVTVNNTFEFNQHVNTGFLYIYNLDGNLLNGNFPVVFNGRIQSSPIVGDINNDGQLEVIISLVFGDGGLYALNKNGEVLWSKFLGNNISSTSSLFNFNQDSFLEIGVSLSDNHQTYILKHDGNEEDGWPKSTIGSNSIYSTEIGSIDNGDFGLVTTVINNENSLNYGIYAWQINGDPIPQFPKFTENYAEAPAIITDLDNDGFTEVIASSNADRDFINSLQKYRGSIYVWDTNSPFIPQNQQWPQFHHDKHLTGCFDCDN